MYLSRSASHRVGSLCCIIALRVIHVRTVRVRILPCKCRVESFIDVILVLLYQTSAREGVSGIIFHEGLGVSLSSVNCGMSTETSISRVFSHHSLCFGAWTVTWNSKYVPSLAMVSGRPCASFWSTSSILRGGKSALFMSYGCNVTSHTPPLNLAATKTPQRYPVRHQVVLWRIANRHYNSAVYSRVHRPSVARR
jgi:hypothetical protein